jgi:glyoxylase-like metal-dependent hydrolase (beta-lactamase superfamily II)
MNLTDYELHSIETGRFGLDGGAMFGVVPRVLWEREHPPDTKNRILMAARSLLVIGEGRKILIDVGNGSKYTEKQQAIYSFDTSHSDLFSSLAKHGLSPSDITDVILTHLHFDHAGGSTVHENSDVKPTFPNARYYVQRDHWLAAISPTERDRGSFFADDFLPLERYGQLELLDGEGELFPGISVRLMHGHTTALQCPVIGDGRSKLFYCADLVPTVSHLSPAWIMAYDLRPLVTLEEKKRILHQAGEEGWLLFFEHDPRTEAVTVKPAGKGVEVDRVVRLD